MRAVLLAFAMISSSASAEDFDWQKQATRVTVSGAMANIGDKCVGLFGFSPVSHGSDIVMSDKLHAYLLLRDSPNWILEKWATEIITPIAEVVAKDPKGSAADEHRAAAAAVAAAKDPSLYDEAHKRYLENALAPYERGLAACSAGARDPYLGLHYWSGTGSLDFYRRDLDAFFDELVSSLRAKK